MNGEQITGSLPSVGLVLLSSGHLSCLCLCPLRRGEVDGERMVDSLSLVGYVVLWRLLC